MSTVNMAQPSPGGSIMYFGTAPFPVNAPLRAGNDAGIILGYRNFANTLDLSGIAIGAPASDPANHDYIILGGAVAAQFIGGVGTLKPTTTDVVSLGDVNQRYSQIVANVVWSMIAMAHAPFTQVYTNLQTFSGAAATPASDYGMLTTNQARLVLSTGSVNGAAELLYNGATVANFQPTAATYGSNGMALGSAARQWNGLYLLPSALANAPLHLGQGLVPTAPANGDVWLTAAGMFAQVAGSTVGPFAPAGAGAVAVQNAGVPLAGGPFSTLDFLGGGVTDGGGGVAKIPAGGGGVTDGGMIVGNLVICSSAGVVNDSGIFSAGGAYNTPYPIVPTPNASIEFGSSALNWKKVHAREVDSDSVLLMNVPAGQGYALKINGVDQLRMGNQATSGTGIEMPQGALQLATQTSGAGASVGTLTNAPAAGDPNFWLPITINGTIRFVPAW